VQHYTGYLLRTAYLRAAGIAARTFDAPAHPRDAAVLATLTAAGALSQQELAERLDVNRTVMVKLIDSLESRGLVERRRNPQDRRAYMLEPTHAAREAMAEMLPRMQRAEGELTAPLSPPEHERLNALLRELIEPPPPMMADRTGFLLARAHHRFHERADAVLTPLGIQIRHFGALKTIARGAASQRAVAEHLGVSDPVVVELVDALEAREIVERRRDRADRRANTLWLTEAGKRTVHAADEALTAITAELTQPIGADGRDELNALLAKLLAA
jgi:DNA-binding MarR family transcriptional regulator